MPAVLQTVVAELLDGLVNAYGPFVIPVLLFAVGAVGYLFLVAVGRAGLTAEASRAETRREFERQSGESGDDADERS
ncbi:hypothetical protein [Halogeometricum limi]|uniref:Uncharacterized protein n=1 Tax=Halogeometricum limi TaxID=555875 RepID=A0A1I6GNH7_9EURY|nr:hypothetical protein [Halogeometricum limi]SFR43775.1 hypothetical protein SAMN04488124_1319 [Halogeometricum limi]